MDEEEFDALMKARPFGTRDAAQWEAQRRSNTRLAMTLGTALWGRTSEDLQRQLVASHPQIPPSFDLADFRELLQWTAQMSSAVRHPPRSGWLDELGRLKDGRSMGLGIARCAPYWVVQNCPAVPSAVSCSRMYWRTCSSSNPTVDTA